MMATLRVGGITWHAATSCLASLLISACCGDMPARAQPLSRFGLDGSDEELLQSIAMLARGGADSVCHPTIVEDALRVRITNMTSRNTEITVIQASETITPTSGRDVIQRARYERFRSATHSYCHIAITLKGRELCATDSKSVAAIMGRPPVMRPMGPHLSGWVIGYDFPAPDGTIAEVNLGDSTSPCSQRFSIHVGGKWE